MTSFSPLSADEYKALTSFPAAMLFEGSQKTFAMDGRIQAISPEMTVCGPAYPIQGYPGDNLSLHQATESAPEGCILVVDVRSFDDAGHFGDVLGTCFKTKKVSGLVIDGSVRDRQDLSEMGFPVFARGTCIRRAQKLIPGTLNVPVVCGGVPVTPGDIVVGDSDGVVVIPRDELGTTIEGAQARAAKEEVWCAELAKGKSTIEVLGLEPLLNRG